jgi:multimeric flavodoxin WrbA
MKQIVLLDGTGIGDDELTTAFSVLTDVLDQHDCKVKHVPLRDIKMAHCIGCFGCWVKTPGVCVHPDPGREIIQTVMQSEEVIFFTPVTYGGYSSILKIIVDRFIPLILPFFGKYHGETHHTLRYSKYPRLVGIGIQRHDSIQEANLFKTLVGRNAINFHASSFSSGVFNVDDDREVLEQGMKQVLSRSDPLPLADEMKKRLNTTIAPSHGDQQVEPGNALLMVGSPKIKEHSTSSIMGEYLTEVLATRGWKSEKLTLKASLFREKGQAKLCSAVDRADLIILAFPLYIDALPYLVTKSFEVIARHLRVSGNRSPQRLFTIVNNGFPEAHQNALALAICRSFAEQCGIGWAGGLAMGAGEILGGGQPLTEPKRSGPPVKHVIEAMIKAGEGLARGSGFSSDAQRLISKVPIPVVSSSVWRWMFQRLAGFFWKRMARENGVETKDMYVKLYAP